MRSKRNENQEWIEILRNGSDSKKKDTMQTIIIQMTIGRDVSWIFSEVVKAVFTKDLELKKLIYLYLSVQAQNNPDQAVLFVNALLKDAENRDSSILRSLAIRTMSSVNLPQVAEYLAEPLSKAMIDTDPYVRKTAALAVAKLYTVAPAICEETGILAKLNDLVCDSNHMVVSNAVAAILSVSQAREEAPTFTENQISSILAAINDASEWGLIQLLEVFRYAPLPSAGAAEATAERLAAKLQHANPAVVIGVIRSLLSFVGWFPPETQGVYLRRISVAFTSLLTSESSEIQYLAIKSAVAVAAAYPGLLRLEPRLLIPRYREAIYVKNEKLQLIQQACQEEDAQFLISELKDLALSEVDPLFVKKSVSTLGNLGLKFASASGVAVQSLVEITQYVVSAGALDDGAVLHVEAARESRTAYTAASQAAVVAIRDLIRCYPGAFEGALAQVLPALVALDDAAAKTAFLDILSLYGHVIESSLEVLEELAESFSDEQEDVQLALLSTAVRLFLNNSTESGQKLVGKLLEEATSATSRCSIDVKERAYFYWRLLNVSLSAAKDILFIQPPVFNGSNATIIIQQNIAQQFFVPKLGFFTAVDHRVIQKREKYIQNIKNDEDDDEINNFSDQFNTGTSGAAVLEVLDTPVALESGTANQEAAGGTEAPNTTAADLDDLFNFG